MSSEIEKLYKNAGVEQIGIKRCSGIKQSICQHNCDECEDYVRHYPPFTAEKQLAIFKIFCRRRLEVSQHVEGNEDLWFGIKATVGDYAVGFNEDFAECLADFVNSLWQFLTPEEKHRIRRILEKR